MAAEMSYFQNGRGHGEMALALADVDFDLGMLRPFWVVNEHSGRRTACVSLQTGRKVPMKKADGSIVTNADGDAVMVGEQETVRVSDLVARGEARAVHNATTLRKDEWITLDRVVQKATRPRLRAWADLAAANPYGGFDGFGTMILEHETMSDEGEAVVDMDMLPEERNIQPRFQLEGTPLPITHAGFFMSRRRLQVSRKAGTPLDMSAGEMAGRRIAEKVEKTTIGIITGLTYGRAADYSRAPTVYGYTNFPGRITKTNMTAPTGSNGTTVLSNWLALRDLLYAQNYYGPFMVYVSNDWDQYLDNLFSTTEPSAGTLRSRLLQIDGISGIRRLDYLTNTFTVLMIQMTPDVAQGVVGMGITTVQWEELGGYLLKFRTLCIHVPRLFEDFAGNCGIAHGTTS